MSVANEFMATTIATMIWRKSFFNHVPPRDEVEPVSGRGVLEDMFGYELCAPIGNYGLWPSVGDIHAWLKRLKERV